jgi:hypothetical protein
MFRQEARDWRLADNDDLRTGSGACEEAVIAGHPDRPRHDRGGRRMKAVETF